MITSRRTFLGTLAIAGFSRPRIAQAQATTKLILLGTGGGPRPRRASSASAQVIVINSVAYVI